MEQHQQHNELERLPEYSDTAHVAIKAYQTQAKDQQSCDLEALAQQTSWRDRDIQSSGNYLLQASSQQDCDLKMLSQQPGYLDKDTQQAGSQPLQTRDQQKHNLEPLSAQREQLEAIAKASPSGLRLSRPPKTTGRPATCGWCGKIFARSVAIPRHQAAACPKRPADLVYRRFACLECGEIRGRKDKIEFHCRQKHGQRPGEERYQLKQCQASHDAVSYTCEPSSDQPLVIGENSSSREAAPASGHAIEYVKPRLAHPLSVSLDHTDEATIKGQEGRVLSPGVPLQPCKSPGDLHTAGAEGYRASAAVVEEHSDSAPSESDTSPESSIFDGAPESIREQSTRPTTHDLSGLVSWKREDYVFPDVSHADSIQSDGCVLGLDATAKSKLSSELASMIFAEMEVEVVPDDLTHFVAGLLYDCAVVLQRRVDRNDIGHQVAIFMRHRRNMIAKELIAEKPVDRPPGTAMGPLEKIALLMSKEGMQGPPDDTDHSNIQDLADEDEIEQPDIKEARSFLTGSVEFTWLLVRLKALCQLEMTGETYTSVRQTYCRSLESGRRGYSFSLNWCPLAFMRSQYPSGAKLSQVICVSGDATRAQATTCEQYVTQTWPDIGPAGLEHLDKYIESETSSPGTGSARQNFELHIKRLPNDSTCIKVVADPNVVLEIGEVLAWFVVACRAGGLKEAAAPTSVLSSPQVSSSLDGNFEISWTSEPLAQSSYLSEETCWHDLFNSCSIAQGYPIPRRTHNEPGLELSLGLMSMLGATSRAVLFDSVLLLKGLCSMFVPLQKAGASVIWHYLVHRDEYCNFSDWMPHYEANHGREPLRSLEFSDLVDCPQYVGWSRETKMVAGSKDARYDEVDFGGKPIKPGFALDGVSISISKMLSVGTKAVAGKKDTPMFQCASGPYEQTINITAKWTALMYDTAERRGWLLDGATALLHMCRAAMTHPDAPEIGRGLSKPPVDSFIYAGANTDAKDILLDKQNRELIIYDDKEKPWTFEDLVLQHWSSFEEMKSHHFKLRAGETKQWEVSNPLSRRLEGFGFVDVLTREPCKPRYHSLSSQASRWLQFTTQCGAINILGSGFDDLIAPLTSCKRTLEALPCGHDLIAAPVGLLHRIARRIGVVSASSIELCDGVYWNDPSRSFASDPCQCIESPQKDLMWRCGGEITSLEGRACVNNCKRRRLVEMIGDYSRGAIILGGRSSRFEDRLCVESSEAQVPVSPQSGKRRAVDEGYSSSRS